MSPIVGSVANLICLIQETYSIVANLFRGALTFLRARTLTLFVSVYRARPSHRQWGPLSPMLNDCVEPLHALLAILLEP